MYPLITIPSFAKKSFFDFTKEDAKQYLQWFFKIKKERIEILENNIQQLYPYWKSDYTRASLVELYKWFEQQVAYRLMNEEEKEAVKKQLNTTPLLIDVIPIPHTTFTVETVSICFDAGLYFGETLIINGQNLKWFQKLTSTNYIDYAQPLIGRKDSKVPINPRRIAESLAQSILDKDVQETTFEMIYDKLVNEFFK